MPIARVIPVESFDLPQLLPYRTMRRYAEHVRERVFVAEGEKVVQRLLDSDFIVVSALLSEAWAKTLEPRFQARVEEIEVFVASKERLEALTGFNLFQGVLAVARIPETLTLAEALRRSPAPRLFAAVDGLTNAENLGVLVRNCAAFGVQALVVGETSSSPYLRRAVRNSMGAIFKLPVVETRSLPDALGALRDAGVRSVAAHPHVEKPALWEVDLTHDCCLVFGSEGYGLSDAVRQACESSAAIPMHSGVDSLNVSCANAAFLYEAQRQRAVCVENGSRP